MIAEIKTRIDLLDADQPPPKRRVILQPGTYNLERIKNPIGPESDGDWLVISGTRIGQPERAWRTLSGEEWGDKRITIEG